MANPCPAADGSSPKQQTIRRPPPMCIDPAKRYTATMVTSKGTLTIALDPIAAPDTVNNFVFLARYHYYEGIVFHRIIPGFVLQGGDPTGTAGAVPATASRTSCPRPAATSWAPLPWRMPGRTPTAASSSSSAAPPGSGSPAVLPVREGGLRSGRGGGDRRHRHVLGRPQGEGHHRVGDHHRSGLTASSAWHPGRVPGFLTHRGRGKGSGGAKAILLCTYRRATRISAQTLRLRAKLNRYPGVSFPTPFTIRGITTPRYRDTADPPGRPPESRRG